MSLTCDQFMRANARYNEIRARVTRILGSCTVLMNHYGRVFLYGVYINRETTDDQIREIHEKYTQWYNAVKEIFNSYNYHIDDHIGYSKFSGNLCLFIKPINIYDDIEISRKIIDDFLKGGLGNK